MKKVCIIIPAYNEEKSLPNLLRQIENTHFLTNYKIIPLVINDGSNDGTRNICHNNIQLNLSSNIGIGGAFQTGLLYAKENGFDIAIQVDGDGQHPPSEINKLLEYINKDESVDIIVGSRYISKSEGFKSSIMRRIGIRTIHLAIWFLSGKKIYDTTSGFRLFNKRALEYFANNYPDEFPEPESLIIASLIGFKVEEISVNMKPRSFGKSSITSFKSIYYMTKVILALIYAFIKSRFGPSYGIYRKQ